MTDSPQTFGFDKAIVLLKHGKRVARKGWNGKGMFVYLNKGSFDASTLGFPVGAEVLLDHPSTIDSVSVSLFECGDEGAVTRLPNLNMKSATGATVTGWLASQTDILAEDWQEA